MSKIKIILEIFLLFGISHLGFGLENKILEDGIRYSYEEKYKFAEKNFFKIIKAEKDNPVGYFFLASLYGLYMADFSTDSLEKEFYAYIDTTIEKANAILNGVKKLSSNAEAHLYIGASYGIRGLYKIQKGDYLGSIQDGINGIKYLLRAVELDSTLYDAYIGLACYDYFKYRLINLVPLVNANNKWEEEIKIAIERSKYLRIAAMTGYALLLEKEGRYEDGIKIANELLALFPNSRTFRWTLVKLYMSAKKWDKAEGEFKKLLDLTLEGQKGNVYNIACCRDGLAEAYFMQGKKEQGKNECREILKLQGDTRLRKFHKKARKRLGE